METRKITKTKGGKHYTKKEIAEMKAREIVGNSDNIFIPDFLTSDQRKEFKLIAAELIRLDLMTNLDSDVLGQYVQAKESYLYYCNLIEQIKSKCKCIDNIFALTNVLKEYENMKDKAFKQTQTCANALGLNIASRGKIKKPVKEEKPPENKFMKFQKSG